MKNKTSLSMVEWELYDLVKYIDVMIKFKCQLTGPQGTQILG